MNSDIQTTTLHNGLTITSQYISGMKSASVNMGIKVGSRYESKTTAGISHFIEHMLFKGTITRPSPLLISDTIEKTGGIINASTDHESTIYTCKTDGTHILESLDLLFDMILNSRFLCADINMERKVIIEEINGVNDFPDTKAAANLSHLMWPNQSLGTDIAGTLESVNNINKTDLIKFHNRYYVPNNICVSLAGNINHSEVVKAVKKMSTNMAPSNLKTFPLATINQNNSKFHLEKRVCDQVHISIGYVVLSRDDPDRYAIDILGVLLGEGMSSRLFNEVREKRGLAYDIGVSFLPLNDVGEFQIYASVDKTRYVEAINVILNEVEKSTFDITEKDIEKSKNLITGRLFLKMEDTQEVADWNCYQTMFDKKPKSFEETLLKISSINIKQIKSCSQKMLSKNKAHISIIGSITDKNIWSNIDVI
jgi:predicted Zn-dependent peptidase